MILYYRLYLQEEAEHAFGRFPAPATESRSWT